MRKNLFFITLLLVSTLAIFAQPKAEIRAVWLTTNGGSDWPKGVYTESIQKQNLIEILDKLESANFNTILLQVQVKGDALWSSTIQPAMIDITGNGAKDLSYNVCDFVIEECHKRNMECHAWIVPYRVGDTSEANRYNNNKYKHVTKLKPELCVSYGGAWYLDPGLPETREYLIELYRELITNHNFDGTHFDYTRYPHKDFDDSASYAKYGNGKDKGDWRRENINMFVHDFYDMAKSIKPNIKVGATPIGTYKNIPGINNNEAYGAVFQDACEWMQAGKQDVLFPQMYWDEKYGFSPNMTTWVDNSDNRQLVVGIAPYKMDDKNYLWQYTVITDQIEKIRAKKGMSGIAFFRTDHVIGNTTKIQQLLTALKNNYFKYPANIVPMPYNGVTKPDAPVVAIKDYSNGKYSFQWEELTTSGNPIKYYNIYASTSPTVDITDIKNCIGFYIKGNSFTYQSANPSLNFVVTAFDNNYFESDPTPFATSNVTDATIKNTNYTYLNHEFSLKSNININDISVYSASGVLAKQASIEGESANISFTDMTSGVYIIYVKYVNGEKGTYKIIR